MEKRIDLEAYPIRPVLERLLQDKTTKRNILFATDAYRENGEEFAETAEITAGKLLGWHRLRIQPRVEKAAAEQLARTRKKAEVFTPSWVVNKMNNYADADWFGRTDVFNTENGISWTATDGPIVFDGKKTWKQYVDTRRIEITCGEAPYIVSRYDAATGEIIPLEERIGFLDRKLRVVNENAADDDEWLRWALRALQSSYGFEFQGDNLLLGRVNVLMTFAEYYEARFHRCAKEKLLHRVVNIISWNLWQMDGLTGTIPYSAPKPQIIQYSLFDPPDEIESLSFQPACLLMNWRRKQSVSYDTIRGEKRRMKWDFAIGNPPYHESGTTNNKAEAVYPFFYECAEKIADRYLLISPARFLFNAGLTSKEWNEKMLSDAHIRIEKYFKDSAEVFPNTNINGGIAIVYRDLRSVFHPVNCFIPDDKLREIAEKVKKGEGGSMTSIIYGGRSDLKFNDFFLHDYPETKGRILALLQEKHPEIKELGPNEEYEIKSSSFERTPYAFLDVEPSDKENYYKILGIEKGHRVYKWVKKTYLSPRYPQRNNIDFFKVFISNSDGAAGQIGKPIPARILGTPVIAEPAVSAFPTFMSIGRFKTIKEARNVEKYVKTRFARVLLGILKITQHITPKTWENVPIQDFTTNSDINWNTSIANIDKQLYKKYGLSPEEIDFIETHVKEMT